MDTEIIKEPVTRIISSPLYEARVEGDGCLTQIKILNEKFLSPDVGISRGSYFNDAFWGGALKFPYVEQTGSHTIYAYNDSASIQYDFYTDKMVWSLSNKSDKETSFTIVFDPGVKAMMNDKGEMLKTIVNDTSKKSVWYRGKARLEISGTGKQWGPWENDHQVLETTVAPGKTHELIFLVGESSDEEMKKINGLSQP
jgi:hypothetical protein